MSTVEPRVSVATKAGRPSHVVVFRSASERTVSSLASNLRLTPMAASGTGTLSFQPRRTSGPPVKVHQHSACAAVDLNDDEIDRLRGDDMVADMAENEQRSIPQPVQTLASPPQRGVRLRHG